ncbi:hypothetical protein LEP1GSC163_0190 [Leptospira santarosai str. CBC379]|nr:hypothetical protein LEP1GSC163_0190 [Leptospira santarosai str. CBC379]
MKKRKIPAIVPIGKTNKSKTARIIIKIDENGTLPLVSNITFSSILILIFHLELHINKRILQK